MICEIDQTSYLFSTTIFEKRTIEEPLNEKVVRGSHEGFVEDINHECETY